MEKIKEPLVTILIPCYEMNGMGREFLGFSLKKISEQSYKNIKVLISDQSENLGIIKKVHEWTDFLDIDYIFNNRTKRTSSANVNYALTKVDKNCKYIKILFEDDFLLDENSIFETINALEQEQNKKWLVSTCQHSKTGQDLYDLFEPRYYDEIYTGEPNSISSPSVLTIKNGLDIFFDEQLYWLMDVDFYKRIYDTYGEPIIFKRCTVVNRVWDGQVGKGVPQSVKDFELNYVKEKFKK
jgi:hypothetical protein